MSCNVCILYLAKCIHDDKDLHCASLRAIAPNSADTECHYSFAGTN